MCAAYASANLMIQYDPIINLDRQKCSKVAGGAVSESDACETYLALAKSKLHKKQLSTLASWRLMFSGNIRSVMSVFHFRQNSPTPAMPGEFFGRDKVSCPERVPIDIHHLVPLRATL